MRASDTDLPVPDIKWFLPKIKMYIVPEQLRAFVVRSAQPLWQEHTKILKKYPQIIADINSCKCRNVPP